MTFTQGIDEEINRLINIAEKRQCSDGTWRFCFESGPLPDALMIILLRSLNMSDERLIRQLVKRLTAKQHDAGYWKLYHDEPTGNVSATIESYYALLLSGYIDHNDPRMQAAKQFIMSAGGVSKASALTQAVLAMTGQIPWPWYFKFPPEIWLLPPSLPFNFFKFSGYARVHLAPIFIAADRNFELRAPQIPNLSPVFVQREYAYEQDLNARAQMAALIKPIHRWIKQLPQLPHHLHALALKRGEQFMLARIEPDGTLYSYTSATFLMIFALLALGYTKNNPIITHAVTGLKRLTCCTGEHIHIQNSTSTVWDTALLSHALQIASVPAKQRMIKKAGQYLLSRQQHRFGDWVIHNPFAIPGGWGFSDINTINPDNDDTTAALRAIHQLTGKDAHYRDAWERGLNWILSMQNDDGGWAAFEKNTDSRLLTSIPIAGAKDAATDPSTADLTGRTLEFLGREAGLTVKHRMIQRAVEWLSKHMEPNGSWYGRWGVCYIYGTWAAITGLMAVRVSPDNHVVQKAVKWLETIQNDDGGWGESCLSDTERRYIPLGASTPSQTAWAVDALIAVNKEPTPTIERGVKYLIESAQKKDWTTTYPTGAGLPGQFYIHYHSYRYVWPLLALGNYRHKCGQNENV